jgi:hypothetical protein
MKFSTSTICALNNGSAFTLNIQIHSHLPALLLMYAAVQLYFLSQGWLIVEKELL